MYIVPKNYLLTFEEINLRNAGYDWVADNYLADFCKQKLAQTGKFIEIAGKRITIGNTQEKARKRTSNKWFETQDSISYWEDFSKPKVVYMEIQTDNPEEGYPFPCYSYDDKRCVVLNTAYIMSSETIDPRYVLGILNSKLGKFLVKLYVTQLQERQFRMLAQYVSNFPIVKPDRITESKMVELVNALLKKNDAIIESQIDTFAYQLFKLEEQEIDYLKALR